MNPLDKIMHMPLRELLKLRRGDINKITHLYTRTQNREKRFNNKKAVEIIVINGCLNNETQFNNEKQLYYFEPQACRYMGGILQIKGSLTTEGIGNDMRGSEHKWCNSIKDSFEITANSLKEMHKQ